MKLIAYLARIGGRRIIAITALGLASGFASTAFIALINHVLHDDGTQRRLLLLALFVLLAVARLAANIAAQWMLIWFAQDKLLSLCDELSRRVIRTSYRALERIGSAKILTTLTEDVSILSAALQTVPSLAGNVAVLLGCLIYLAYISWTASIALFFFTACGAFLYRLLLRKAYKAIQEARAGRDTLFGHFRALTEGLKEIKMSTARQAWLIDQGIGRTAQELRKQNMVAMHGYLIAEGWSNAMFCVMMGFLLFALPAVKGITLAGMTGYAFVALYAMAPVWGLIGSVPTFHRGQAALERIEALGISLSAEERVGPDSGHVLDSFPDPPSASMLAPTIELDRVAFSYHAVGNGQNSFVLGPLSVTLHSGQLIFIIGGNGSGKTTLVKLLTGLYSPDSGEIRVEGRTVPADSQNYRQLFSPVFADFYLFDRLLAARSSDLDDRGRVYLERLQLDKKVRIEDGVLSTTALSQGQRRRLALLSAYLDDRPIYVFDEWAADQDPAYKEIFYAHLLPELKARGKTVVVITHDDRYFQFGDVVIKLDYGNIIECWSPTERVRQDGVAPVVVPSAA